MQSMTPFPASTITLATTLRDHFTRVVLPLWRGPGFNPVLKLPYDAPRWMVL